MSSSQPSRRRRIAGERRRASSVATVDTTPPPPPPASPSAPPSTPTSTGGAVRLEKSSENTTTGSRSWWGSPQSIVGLAVALTVMLTLVVLGALGRLGNTGIPEVREAEDTQVAAESAPSVAERAAEAILAYDHSRLDTDQDAAERFMTPSFAEKYADTFDRSVEPTARSYRAQVSAQVHGSSVVRASDDQVRVLLFVDQTTRSTAHDRPQVALNRVEFEMALHEGEWLVDGISSY